MLARPCIILFVLIFVNSCSTVIKIPDSESALLLTNTIENENATIYSDYYSIDEIRISNYNYENVNNLNNKIYKVPSGNRKLSVVIAYDQSSRNFDLIYKYFDFNVTLKPKKIYSIYTNLDKNNVTVWIEDNASKIVSNKITLSLGLSDNLYKPRVFDMTQPIYYYTPPIFEIPDVKPIEPSIWQNTWW